MNTFAILVVQPSTLNLMNANIIFSNKRPAQWIAWMAHTNLLELHHCYAAWSVCCETIHSQLQTLLRWYNENNYVSVHRICPDWLPCICNTIMNWLMRAMPLHLIFLASLHRICLTYQIRSIIDAGTSQELLTFFAIIQWNIQWLKAHAIVVAQYSSLLPKWL